MGSRPSAWGYQSVIEKIDVYKSHAWMTMPRNRFWRSPACLARNRCTVRAALKGVEPADRHGGHARWSIAVAREALGMHDVKVEAQRAVNTSAAGGDSPADAGGADQRAFREHRAEWMRQKRIALERENARRAGELISIADAVQVQAQMISAAKVKLLALPTKIAVPHIPADADLAWKFMRRLKIWRGRKAAKARRHNVFVGPRPEFIVVHFIPQCC